MELDAQPDMIPRAHKDFLQKLCRESLVSPKVIYDIGACLLHWTTAAQTVWPSASYYLLDGFVEAEPLWIASGLPFYGGVLSDTEKEVAFYVNPQFPGGNSYYREIGSAKSHLLFPESSKRSVTTATLDSVRLQKNWPVPDLVKMDVQGAELDIYRGAQETLKTCQYLILELQHKQYNEGAPLAYHVIHELQKDGWELLAPLFTLSEFDGDYCFINTRVHSPATVAHSHSR
jgi:FkbM family methyltransferase